MTLLHPTILRENQELNYFVKKNHPGQLTELYLTILRIKDRTSQIPLYLKTRRKNEENSRIQQTELYLTIPHMKDQASQISLYPTIHRKNTEASHNRE